MPVIINNGKLTSLTWRPEARRGSSHTVSLDVQSQEELESMEKSDQF